MAPSASPWPKRWQRAWFGLRVPMWRSASQASLGPQAARRRSPWGWWRSPLRGHAAAGSTHGCALSISSAGARWCDFKRRRRRSIWFVGGSLSRKRLFLAVDIDEATRAQVGRISAGLREPIERHAKVSWVPPERMHLTLHFLGNVDDAFEQRI